MSLKSSYEKLSTLEKQYVNWNYIGLAAGILTVLVSAYNIRRYLKAISKDEDNE